MSMQVGEAGGEEDTPMSDINTTPLVDVMLVLLIIFLITVPVVLQTVPVELPKVRLSSRPTTKPENVNLSVPRDERRVRGLLGSDAGELGGAAQPGGRRARAADRARSAACENVTEENMPEAHIRGDINTPYRCIGGAIYHHAARRLRPHRLHFRAAAAAAVSRL